MPSRLIPRPSQLTQRPPDRHPWPQCYHMDDIEPGLAVEVREPFSLSGEPTEKPDEWSDRVGHADHGSLPDQNPENEPREEERL